MKKEPSIIIANSSDCSATDTLEDAVSLDSAYVVDVEEDTSMTDSEIDSDIEVIDDEKGNIGMKQTAKPLLNDNLDNRFDETERKNNNSNNVDASLEQNTVEDKKNLNNTSDNPDNKLDEAMTTVAKLTKKIEELEAKYSQLHTKYVLKQKKIGVLEQEKDFLQEISNSNKKIFDEMREKQLMEKKLWEEKISNTTQSKNNEIDQLIFKNDVEIKKKDEEIRRIRQRIHCLQDEIRHKQKSNGFLLRDLKSTDEYWKRALIIGLIACTVFPILTIYSQVFLAIKINELSVTIQNRTILPAEQKSTENTNTDNELERLVKAVSDKAATAWGEVNEKMQEKLIRKRGDENRLHDQWNWNNDEDLVDGAVQAEDDL